MKILGYVLATIIGFIGFRLLITAAQAAFYHRVLVRRGALVRWESANSPQEAWGSALRLGLLGILLLILSGAIVL
ncbi:MAG: hypothetical protein ACE5H9_09230 [Anaerolineae bacterium]